MRVHWCKVIHLGSSLLFLVRYLTGARFTILVLYLSLTKNSQGKWKSSNQFWQIPWRKYPRSDTRHASSVQNTVLTACCFKQDAEVGDGLTVLCLSSQKLPFPISMVTLGTRYPSLYQLLCGLFYLKNLMTLPVDGIPQQLNHRHRSSLTHGQISWKLSRSFLRAPSL